MRSRRWRESIIIVEKIRKTFGENEIEICHL